MIAFLFNRIYQPLNEHYPKRYDQIKLCRWSSGQPDNLLGKENCLVLDIKPGSALLSDVNCDSRYQYICEVLILLTSKLNSTVETNRAE